MRRAAVNSLHHLTAAAVLPLAALASLPVAAYDLSFPGLGLEGTLSAQVSLGATMRTESRDPDLVGKLNLPGQQQFCEDALIGATAPGINCTTVEGNAAYLALRGYPGVNNDDGDLNYDRGDIVNAAVRFAPRLQLTSTTTSTITTRTTSRTTTVSSHATPGAAMRFGARSAPMCCCWMPTCRRRSRCRAIVSCRSSSATRC
jgi:hypothetical protein